MSWFDFARKETETPASGQTSEALDIALFPLNGVLFPGGVMALRVFEQRYLDLAAHCLKHHAPFGVCLIASGKEVGTPAIPHDIGTLALIDHADVPQLGTMQLSIRGGRRFRILARSPQHDGLLRARVELLDERQGCAVPEAQLSLLPLLRKVVSDLGPHKVPTPHAYDDTSWVGYRLSEIVPVQALAKQKLLELDDPVSRLEILHTYLAQRQLVT